MGRTENFLWTKNHHYQSYIFYLLCGETLLAEIFVPVFYNIRKDTGITVPQSNVRKIYADLKTVSVNSYGFFMSQRLFPVS